MSDEFCIAVTEYGRVRGAKVISEVGKPYWRFLGIPYAKPPVGELRFQKASKASPWDGVLDALKEPSPCAGKNSYIKKFVGSDDCLYLNIYTKNIKPEKPSAVFVYIHGGGFFSGSSTLQSYSPDYLLMHDIVVVIFNYRIGPLGFLSLKDKNLNVPGNSGLKDQQIVLEFVRENIQNFGGDAKNVTLVGHSSGAVCVGLHCLSESSRGLFDRAIMLGGSPIFQVSPQFNWAQKLAVKLGFDEKVDDVKEILKFLEKFDAVEMAEVASGLIKPEEYKDFGVHNPFWPSIENHLNNSTFLSKNPVELLENAWSKEIDILIGGNADEGFYPFKSELEDDFPFDLRALLKNFDEIIENCKKYYSEKFENENDVFEKYKGDTFPWLGVARFSKSRLNSQKAKTFIHKFAVDSPTQNHYRNRWCGSGSKGVCHADELSYMWKNGQGGVPDEDSMEFRAIKIFTSMLVNFCKTGDPGISVWQPVNDFPPKALTILPDELKFDKIEEFERIRDFWVKLYEEVGVKFC